MQTLQIWIEFHSSLHPQKHTHAKNKPITDPLARSTERRYISQAHKKLSHWETLSQKKKKVVKSHPQKSRGCLLFNSTSTGYSLNMSYFKNICKITD